MININVCCLEMRKLEVKLCHVLDVCERTRLFVLLISFVNDIAIDDSHINQT